MQRILCVEDTPEVLTVLKAALKGYDITTASSLAEARGILKGQSFSLILMDIELPDGTGYEVMSEFQDLLKHIPVIFVTGKKDFASKVSAFSLGADDFILKPFDPMELRLRVDSKLRKIAEVTERASILTVGNLVCNLQDQRVHRSGGANLDLTTIEFRILRLFATTPSKVFTRGEILARVWGDNVSVTERTVDVHISHLRKKLEGTGVGVEAVVGSGYRIQVRSAA